MSRQSAIQSTLHLNRRVITDLITSLKIDKALRRAYYKLSDKNDKQHGADYFNQLNFLKDKIREGQRRLKQLAELQVVLKKSLKVIN